MQRKPIPTISIHVVRGAFAEAIAHGEEPAALCPRFGVTPEQLADTDVRVGADLMGRIDSVTTAERLLPSRRAKVFAYASSAAVAASGSRR